MQNVKIADDKVSKLRSQLSEAFGRPTVQISVDDVVGYLQSLERLAALERHLYNLISNGYR